MSSAEFIINMIDEIRLHGFEKVFKRYYGIYRGYVKSNADPQGRGRIKVVVPDVFGEKVLPTFALPKDMRGAGSDKGEFYPPDIKDGVWIEFEAGDPRFPVYSGGWHAAGELAEEFAYSSDGAPVNRGFKNKYGHSLRFDETEGEEKIVMTTLAGHFFVMDDTDGSHGIFFIHNSGAQFQVDNDGNLKIFGSDGAFIFMNADDGEISITSKDGAYVSLSDQIKVSDATGSNWMTMNDDGLTVAGGGVVVNGNALVANVGSASIKDLVGAGFVVGNGKIAIGSQVIELVDGIIQIIDAFTSGSPLVTTGTGPSSPLLPPALTQLTLLKVLLTSIKGVL